MRSGTQQHRKAACTRTDGCENAHRQDQADAAVDEGGQCRADHQDQQAIQQNRTRAILVGQCTCKGLDGTPHKLRNGHGQADGDNAQTCVCVEWAHIKPHRLPRAHGDHEDGRGHEGGDPHTAVVHAGEKRHTNFEWKRRAILFDQPFSCRA